MRVSDLGIGGRYEVEIGGQWELATFAGEVPRYAGRGAWVGMQQFRTLKGGRAEYGESGVETRVRAPRAVNS